MRQSVWYCLMVWVFFSCTASGQDEAKMIPVGALPAELVENSGLVMIGPDEYLGINDSGHEPTIYVFSLKKKIGTRIVKVTNATNVDWEEVTADKEYLYIGDFGNNEGDRHDLAIYKVKLHDLRIKYEVTAEKISFAFPEQKKFIPSKKTNYDCEAMVSIGDSLYLFTKNHGNFRTLAYSLPKVPGTYRAHRLGMFDAEGMVTGASYRSSNGRDELIFIGYKSKKNDYHPFIIHFTDIKNNRFFESPMRRVVYTSSSLQLESIVFKDENTAYVSNEEEHGDPGLVYRIALKY